MCDSCALFYTYKCEQFLNLCCFTFRFGFVCFCLGLQFIYFVCVSLGQFIPVLLAFAVGFLFSVLRLAVKNISNMTYLCGMVHKTLTQSVNSSRALAANLYRIEPYICKSGTDHDVEA